MYQLHKFMLTPKQLKLIKKSLEEDIPSSLTIKQEHFNGEHPLPITDSELKHVKDGDGYVTVSLNKKKLQHIRDNKSGGFLPLLTLLPAILGGLGALGGIAGGAASIASSVNKKKNEDERLEEERRHNRELESKLGSAMGNNSVKIGQTNCVHCGGILILKAKRGRGLYLSPYSSGMGLITSIANAVGNPATNGNPLPPLPEGIKDIPIIGSLASLLY